MQTECSAKPSEFTPVEGRSVVAECDGGAVTSDAGGLLLGAADKAIGLVHRLAGCFRDVRDGRYIEHTVATLVGQRVFGIALGYEAKSAEKPSRNTVHKLAGVPKPERRFRDDP